MTPAEPDYSELWLLTKEAHAYAWDAAVRGEWQRGADACLAIESFARQLRARFEERAEAAMERRAA